VIKQDIEERDKNMGKSQSSDTDEENKEEDKKQEDKSAYVE
jgi:hypothetical protein